MFYRRSRETAHVDVPIRTGSACLLRERRSQHSIARRAWVLGPLNLLCGGCGGGPRATLGTAGPIPTAVCLMQSLLTAQVTTGLLGATLTFATQYILPICIPPAFPKPVPPPEPPS